MRRRARERAKESIARAMALEHGGQVRRTCKKKMAGHCRQDGFRFAIRRKTLGTKYDACYAWPGQVSVERAVEGVGSIEKQVAIHTCLASKVVQTMLWMPPFYCGRVEHEMEHWTAKMRDQLGEER